MIIDKVFTPLTKYRPIRMDERIIDGSSHDEVARLRDIAVKSHPVDIQHCKQKREKQILQIGACSLTGWL